MSVLVTKKRPFRRAVEKPILFESLEAVWGYEIFFQNAVKISEQIKMTAPWFTKSFEEILKRIQKKPAEGIDTKQEKND